MEDRTGTARRHPRGGPGRRSRSPGAPSRLPGALRSLAWLLLAALLLAFPLFHCGGKFWYLPLMGIAVSLTWVFRLVGMALQGRRIGDLYRHPGMLLFLLPLLWAGVQLIPWGGALSLVSARSAWYWREFGRLGLPAGSCISLAPQATCRQMCLLAICLGVFAALLNLARSRHDVRWLMFLLTGGSFLEAAVSLAGYFLAGAGGRALDAAFSGGFLNRNHFACFLGMGILAGLGLALSLVCEKPPDDPFEFSWRKLVQPLVLALFVQAMALMLTLSRGGNLTVCLGVAVLAGAWLAFARVRRSARQRIVALGLIAASALMCAMPFVLGALTRRFEDISDTGKVIADNRWLLWRNSLQVLRDFPWTGCGLGGFGDVIQAYENGSITSGYIVYAHNDWLQLLVETGIPFLAVLAALAAWLAGRTLAGVWRQPKPMYRWCGLASFVSLATVGLHELVDFNLQSYPNALAASVLLAVFCICGRRERSYEERQAERNRHPWGRGVFLAAAALLLAALPWQGRALLAGIHHARLYDLLQDGDRARRESPASGDRLVELADKAGRLAPHDAAVLRRTAEACLERSRLRPGAAPAEKERDWRRAWDCLAEACGRRPLHGEDAYLLAFLYDRGRRWLPDYSFSRQAALYEWVMRCQPTLQGTAYDVAVGYYYLYREARADGGVPPEELEGYRDRCLQLFAESCRRRSFGDDRRAFAMIWHLMPDVPGLLRLLPFSPSLHESLFLFLMRNGSWKDAGLVLRQMAGELPGKDDDGTAGRAAGSQERCQAARRLQTYRRELALMTGCRAYPAADERAYREACRACELRRWRALREEFPDDGLPTERIWDLVRDTVFLDEPLVEGAEICRRSGRVSDMVMLLLHLAYRQAPPDAETLRRAEAMIGGSYGFSHPGILVRFRFLRSALPILAAERSPAKVDRRRIRRHVVLLQELQREMAETEGRSWSQRHLIPFYIGRACELLGEPAGAADAYAQALRLSPANLWIRRRLEHVRKGPAGSIGAEAEPESGSGPGPLGYLGRSVAVLWASAVPERIAAVRETAELRFRLLCTAPLSREVEWRVSCRVGRQVFHTGELEFPSGRGCLAWRAGEETVGRMRFSPMLEAMKAAAAVRDERQVVVELTPLLKGGAARPLAADYPRVAVPAFTMRF